MTKKNLQIKRALLEAAHLARLLAYGDDSEYFMAWAVYFEMLATGQKCEEPT